MARVPVPFPIVAAKADDVHEWLSFDHDGDTYTFDVTFLLSNWTCIYGAGCPGIGETSEPELELGCCSWGAHFTGKKDRKRTMAKAAELGPDEWQHHDRAAELGGAVFRNDEGTWQTHVLDGGCIFLNRPGFPAGAGCALHQAALRRGESYIDWKPEVCWQVPIRLDFHRDDNDHLTHILREWKRRDWGAGGDDFHWWCTEDDRAFIGIDPVYVACRPELEALVGAEPTGVLTALLDVRRGGDVMPHPALNREAPEAERMRR